MALIVFIYFSVLFYYLYKSIRGTFLIYNFVCTFVYILIINGLLSWMMHILHYQLTDIVLIISYFILIVIILFLNKLSKNSIFIKSKINSFELIFLLISVLLFAFFYYVRFQNGNSISFETTNPAVHYDLFKTYFKNRELMLSIPSEIYTHMSDYPALFYVNCAIFYIMFPFINDYSFYIIFNILLCLISSLLFFYLLIFKIESNSKSYIISIILSIILSITLICALLIFGFSSQIMVLPIVIEFMILNSTNAKYFNIKSNLLLIGILLSYYYYFPIVIFSLLLTIYLKEKKILKFLYNSLKATVFAIIMYYIIFIIFNVEPVGGKTHLLNTEGYIFRDLYSSLILFIPMSLFIFYMFIKLKMKDFIFDNVVFIFSISFSICLFFMAIIFEKVSSYYFFKNHLMIYLVVLNSSFIFLYYYAKPKYVIIVCVVSFLLFLSLKPLEKYRINTNRQILTNILPNFNLFEENYRLLYKKPILDKEQLKNISLECNTFYKTSSVLQSLWIYSISGCNPKYFQALGGTAFDNVREFYNNNNNIDARELNVKIIDLINIKE